MWLKKRKADNSVYADRTARWIANGIVSLQTRLARILKRLENKASLQQKKSILIIFCMIAGAYCFYLLGDALLRKPAIRDYLPVKNEQMIRSRVQPPAPGTLTHADTVQRRHGPVPASLRP